MSRKESAPKGSTLKRSSPSDVGGSEDMGVSPSGEEEPEVGSWAAALRTQLHMAES